MAQRLPPQPLSWRPPGPHRLTFSNNALLPPGPGKVTAVDSGGTEGDMGRTVGAEPNPCPPSSLRLARGGGSKIRQTPVQMEDHGEALLSFRRKGRGLITIREPLKQGCS